MPTNNITLSLAEISTYLWSNKILQDKAFKGGSIDDGRDTLIYLQRKSLQYGIDQNISGVTGVAQYIYHLLGGQVQLANQVLVNGSGGTVIPSTGSATTFRSYRTQFNVGDIGSLFVDGSTTATIDIGNGSNFLSNSMQISLDQVLLPENNNNYVSYTVSYAAGIVTIKLNAAAVTGQLYIIQFDYIIA